MSTYVWKTTISAAADLGLVDVDEDLRVTQWATAAIALDDPLLLPSHGLLVDELDGRVGLGLLSRQLYVHLYIMSFPFRCGHASSHRQATTDAIQIDHVQTDLKLHDRLLKTRTRHGLLPRPLALGPRRGPVRSLQLAVTLARFGRLLQRRIPAADRLEWCGVGFGDVGLGLLRGGVVGRDEVLGEARGRRGVSRAGDDDKARS